MKQCKKYLIADALLNYSKNSITEFIEPSKNSELSKIAEEKGIILPSPDLMLFRTIYAKIGEPNRNNVVINRKPVEKSLQTLIAKQINLEHEGKNYICGHVLDAKIENEYIVIYGVFYKSLFQEEYKTLKELFADKKVYVSFEIWSKDPESGKSVMHDLENGIREINPIIFHGVGLLMKHLPACKEAVLDKILGQKLLENAEQIIDKVFDENLIYASFDYEESKCLHCTNCICEKEADKVEEILIENDYEGGEIEEAKKLTTEQRNALPDEDFALIQEKDGKKIRRFPINDEAHVRNALARLPQAKDITEEERKSALEKILKKAKELNMTELLQKYEKSEESPVEEVKTEESKEHLCPECNQPMKDDEKEMCAECLKKKEQVTEEYKPTEETKPVDAGAETKPEGEETKEAQVVEAPAEPKKIVKIVTEESVMVTEIPEGETYKTEKVGLRKRIVSFSDGTEEISTESFEVVDTFTMAQVEEKVNIAKVEKDKEIADLKTAIEKLDTEIKNLKEELGKKDQEIAELKPKDEEPIQDKKIDVGEVKGKEDPEIKRRIKEMNKIIAEKHQQ